MENEERIREKIAKYISMIKEGSNVRHALKRLENIPMTLDRLSETGVGKIVNGLRNDSENGKHALEIVEKWKNVARQYGLSERQSGSDSENSDDTSSPPPREPSSSHSTANKQKRKPEVTDAFAAVLAAADTLKVPKLKKRRTATPEKSASTRSFIDSPESVLEAIGKSVNAVPLTQNSQSSSLSSASNSTLDGGMFKSRKNGKTKIYAGRKKTFTGEVPSLFNLCIRICQENIDAIEETGDIPFDILRPILEKCSDVQLARIESRNSYLEEETDCLWERHVNRAFPRAEKDDYETWKECYSRLAEEREERLKHLSIKISNNARESAAPQRKALLADPIAPRNARRAQIKNGTLVSSSRLPSAAELSKSRRQIFETGNTADLRELPQAVRNTTSRLGGHSGNGPLSKPTQKKGALMQKTLKMMKARKH